MDFQIIWRIILYCCNLQLPEEQKAVLKEQIINCVQNEPNKNVRRKVADLAAEVARNLTDDDGNNLWPEFLKFLFTMASSQSVEAKEISLHMFASVPRCVVMPNIFMH